MNRNTCDTCGQLATLIFVIERDGFRWRVCERDLRRGDKVFHGPRKRDYTIHTYQTN